MRVGKPSRKRSGKRRVHAQQSTGKRMLHTVSLAVAILLLCWMAWDVVFSDHGYLVYRTEQQQLDQLHDEIAHLHQQQKRIAQQVLRLRNDPAALEAMIHRELGYVHPDEYVLVLPGKEARAGENF